MAKLIPVVALAALKKRQPACAEHRGVPYCVVKTGGEVKKIRAFVSVCSHKDLAMFPPEVEGKRLVCPYHDVAFDAATGQVANSRGKKVDSLIEVKTEIIEGIVHLETRKRHRKLLSKGERKWVAKEAKKLEKKRCKAEQSLREEKR